MAVYERSYRPYDGPLTPAWSRFLVIPRYALRDMRRRRFLSLFYVASFLYPLLCGLFIHLHHNLAPIEALGINPVGLIAIDGQFFWRFLEFQCVLAFFLTAFVGPGLISPDLANNGLPLYLARPFSRTEFVLGKMSVLMILASLMTWVPAVLLFALQGYLEGGGWAAENLRVAIGMLLVSLVWILLLSLLSLALSAWVKWKPIAGALLFGIFFVAAGFGVAVNQVLRTKWGLLMNLPRLIATVAIPFLQPEEGQPEEFFEVMPPGDIPQWCAWLTLSAVVAVSLYLLSRKIRGVEVVR